MKWPHWLVVALAVACTVAPFFVQSLPAKYSGIGTLLLAILGTLKVESLKQGAQ